MASKDPKTLVVGAGPTGLTAALELARRGLPVRIIDRDKGPTPLSKAVGVSAHTLDLLEPSGVTARLLEAGTRIERGYVWYERQRLGTIDFTALPHRFNFLLSLPQSETEAAMAGLLEERGIPVEWERALTAIEPNGDSFRSGGAAVVLDRRNGRAGGDGGNSREETHFDYVFGADGAHSAVRLGAGIKFPGYAHDRDWSIADVELDDWFYEPNAAHIFLHGDGDVGFTIPIGPLRYRVISNTNDALKRVEDGFQVARVLRSDVFKIEVRQAETYQAGAAFLGGDAAHVHSPVGARGMNLGIEDAAAFATHLAEGDLSGYTAERKPVGGRWIELSERMLRAAQANRPGLVAARNLAFRVVGHARWLQRPLLKRVSGLVE
ncbi:MAG TPA: FAD-dependent oxidoreductase [Candidatus Binatia bacterium]|nr:FAD-dependent oxidoreductase [Candidatus Binatia bacterium]